MKFLPTRKEAGEALESGRAFVEENLVVVRSAIITSLAAYWIVLFRRTRPFFRFRCISSIPCEDFKQKNLLKGIVTHTDGSRLKFFHRTVIDRITSPDYQIILQKNKLKADKAREQSLDIRLFGIETTHPVGLKWISAALKHKQISISLLYIDDVPHDTLASSVSDMSSICALATCRLDGYWFKRDIGMEILRRGLGTVRTEEPGKCASNNLKDIRELTKTLDSYALAEADARRHKRGIWEHYDEGPRIFPRVSFVASIWNWFRRH